MAERALRADALNPRELFEGSVHYEIPPFQRPYVWSEEDQWEPLWQDVCRVAGRLLGAGGDELLREEVGGHFLGAVVFKSKPPVAGDVTRHAVIDGQQRTTTLQVLLDAVQEAIAARGYELEAEALEELIVNRANRFRGKPERFKLWPSRADRAAFAAAMDGQAGEGEHRIAEAHRFFRRSVDVWLDGTGEDGPPAGSEVERVRALADVMQTRLHVVAINLAGHDDDQVIFETLNDRGTPLLKADLIKNWVFQVGDQIAADVASWPDTHWVDFDDDWWREQISQGRHLRSRIDIFLQYWLTMRTGSEILTDNVFREFVDYARERMQTPPQAEALLGELRLDADTFRSFAQLSSDTVEGRFYARVIEALELASTTPLFLWLLSPNHGIDPAERTVALDALESWVIRRTLLRRTMQDINKMMVAIVATLEGAENVQAGATVVDYLKTQTAEARRWPSDTEVKEELPGQRLYGNVRQARLRVVLEALEGKLRSDRNEAVTLPAKLEIEHVMPQGWRHYWDEDPPLTDVKGAARDKLVNTLGNLTLLTKKLNGALSHRPWSDEDAAPIGGKGADAGLGKRSLITKYSLLALSKQITEQHPGRWDEQAIRLRSQELARLLCSIWPGPTSNLPDSVDAGPDG